jgi:hypothetical protein
MSEETVVQFGAPTLAGIKTGSLFSCLYDTKAGVYEDVRRLNRVLTPRGLCLLPLRFGEKRVLMYLFRPSGLATDLRCRGARRILRDAGYDDASMGKCMRCLIRRLRESVPGITLRTTAMVGFPGETEEDFEELCAFIKEARFDRFGAFTFSPEEGTEAAAMEGQIDEDVKNERLDVLMEIQLDVSAELQKAKVGETVRVLAEGYDIPAGIHYGRSAADAGILSERQRHCGLFVSPYIDKTFRYCLHFEFFPLHTDFRTSSGVRFSRHYRFRVYCQQ